MREPSLSAPSAPRGQTKLQCLPSPISKCGAQAMHSHLFGVRSMMKNLTDGYIRKRPVSSDYKGKLQLP